MSSAKSGVSVSLALPTTTAICSSACSSAWERKAASRKAGMLTTM